MSKLGTVLLLNAFVRRGMAERPSYKWIGRADTDAAYNLTAVSWRLQAVHAAVAGGLAGAPRGVPMAYGPFLEWFMWRRDVIRFACWARGPERWQSAMTALQEAGGNISMLPHHMQDCVRIGQSGPFPFAGGPLAIYSRALVQALTSTTGFADDELALRREMDADPRRSPQAAGRNALIAEDVYYAHLTYTALRGAPLLLVTSDFDEGEERLHRLLTNGCTMQKQLKSRRISATIYHGFKSDQLGWPMLQRFPWLLNHEASEALRCEALTDMHDSLTHCCGAWRFCRFTTSQREARQERLSDRAQN